MPDFRITRPTLRVLAQLLEDRDGWHYGYTLSQGTTLASGTLYPILQRLAEHGWLTTKWGESEIPGRPPRHLYRLTALGEREAKALVAAQRGARVEARLRSATS
jgi:PadR family transcriptional regulator PadR